MRGVVAEMRSIIDEFKDRLLIGEEIYLPLERLGSVLQHRGTRSAMCISILHC